MYVMRGLGASAAGAALEAGLISAGVGVATSFLIGPIKKLISGCGPSCVQTSNYANEAQSILDQNLKAYFAIPAPRAASVQAAFLANFDAVWNHFEAQCAAVGGAAGNACMGDRQAGACKWQANGACWNWHVGFRDPIAHDADVAPDSVVSSLTGAFQSLTSSAGGSSWLPLALVAGVVAVLAFS